MNYWTAEYRSIFITLHFSLEQVTTNSHTVVVTMLFSGLNQRGSTGISLLFAAIISANLKFEALFTRLLRLSEEILLWILLLEWLLKTII